MATIKLQRTSEYNNRLRDYQIFVDGQKVGTISNGQTKEFETPPGEHKIFAKIDWCSSQEISFKAAETQPKSFLIGGFKIGNWIMLVSIGIIALHFILKYTIDFSYTIFLIIPAFLLLLYYLTTGRKKYLTLTEV